jgi:hypothetical protein
VTNKKIIDAIKGNDGLITNIANALQADTRAARILINMKVRDTARTKII